MLLKMGRKVKKMKGDYHDYSNLTLNVRCSSFTNMVIVSSPNSW